MADFRRIGPLVNKKAVTGVERSEHACNCMLNETERRTLVVNLWEFQGRRDSGGQKKEGGKAEARGLAEQSGQGLSEIESRFRAENRDWRMERA